jgi:hypothetical protein
VLGRGLGDDAICRDHVENIEVLEDRSGEGYVTVAWLALKIAGDLCVSGLKGDDSFEAIVVRALRKVAATLREIQVSLGFDFGAEG